MNLLSQLLIGSVMIGITVMMHAVALDFLIRHAKSAENFIWQRSHFIRKPIMASVIVLSIFMVHVVQIWLWAMLYLALGCAPLEDLADALYFATVTYTTVGYGDITLEHGYRMLSGVEAANGFIMFGWSTAFIFELINRLYRVEAQKF